MAVQIQQREVGDVMVLDLKGKLAGDATETLASSIDGLVKNGHRQLVLNLGGVSFVDSAALGGLLSQRAVMREAGGQLKLLNLNERISDLLVTTKLETVFDSFNSESAAVESFS